MIAVVRVRVPIKEIPRRRERDWITHACSETPAAGPFVGVGAERLFEPGDELKSRQVGPRPGSAGSGAPPRPETPARPRSSPCRRPGTPATVVVSPTIPDHQSPEQVGAALTLIHIGVR
jgi:hypothetical protein